MIGRPGKWPWKKSSLKVTALSAFSAMPTAVSLPETVAEAVVGAGGLGLAAEMYSNFQGVGK